MTLLTAIKNDIKLLFTSEGRATIKKENHHKHFFWSFPIGVVTFFIAMWSAEMWSQPWDLTLPVLFITTFATAFANSAREIYYIRYGAPFSYADIRFGSYGGFIAGLVCWLITLFV
jgi:hypothetical protein